MDPSCPTCAALTGADRCPFHTAGSRKLLSQTVARGAADGCPQCGETDVDLLDAFHDTENRAWHPMCAVVALRAIA